MTDASLFDGPATDVVHSTLADAARRAVVRTLATNGGTGTVAELARVVAGEGDPESGGSTHRHRHRIRLHHHHLPKLADAGVVEYDVDAGHVRLTAFGETVERVRRTSAELLADR